MRKFIYPEMKITEIDEKSFLLTTSGMPGGCEDEDCYEDCDEGCEDEPSYY